MVFKNCASFTDGIREINNTEIDNAKDIDIVMPMYNLIVYNLIEYSDNFSKTGTLGHDEIILCLAAAHASIFNTPGQAFF